MPDTPYRDEWVSQISPTDIFRHQKYCKGEYLYVWINKTAGLSIANALGFGKNYNHYTAMELREIVGADQFTKLFKFCFVRNPWDRVFSQFRFRIWTGQNELTPASDFSDWVTAAYVKKDPKYVDWEKMFLPQIKWITDEEGSIAVDFVGRFENLQEDFGKVCDALGITRLQLPHANRSRKNPDYRRAYTAHTQAIVADYFRADIEHFGYRY